MSAAREKLGLPAGAKVGRYRLEKIHAPWGFYLTYLAEDTADGRAVAVHELVPEEFTVRAADGALRGTSEQVQENLAWARAKFLREGRGLAACAHPALQKVREVFEANGTAYWITPRDETRTFKAWLQDLRRAPTEAELHRLLTPLLGALERAHAAGLPHLGLKPDAIQMTAGGQPVLTHFCGARQAIARRCHEAAAVTGGYSAPEQYDLEKNGDARADIYSLAAVLHRALTGSAPPDAEQRVVGEACEPLAVRCAGRYGAAFLAAVDAALALDPAARPPSVGAWRKMLGVAERGGFSGFVQRHPRSVLAVTATVTVMNLWFMFRPAPEKEPEKTKDEEKEKAKDEKRTEEKKEEQAKQEEQKKKAEEEQRERERKLAEEKEAAEKAAMEKQAKDEAARLAEEAAKAAEKAEAAKRAAEEAARQAQAEQDAVKKIAAEKAAAQAAAGAAKAQAEAEKAQAKKQTAEASAKAAMEKQAQDEAARLAQAAAKAAEKAEAAKRAAEEAARQAQTEQDVAKKIAAEKAAAQAAADAAKAKEAAQAAAVEVKTAKMGAALADVQKASVEEAAAARALAEKAAAEKQAAEQAAAQKSAEAKKAAESAARDKAAAEKSAAEKSVAAAGSREQAARAIADLKTLQAQFAAEKAAAEKAAAETAAKQASAATTNVGPAGLLHATQALQARAAEAAQRAAAAQQAAQRTAQEKAAAEKLVEQAAAETAAARKAKDSPNAAAPKSSGFDPNREKYEHVESTENSTFAGNRSAGEIMGIWETVATDAQGKAERKLTVYGDGRYLISDNAGWEDHGDIYANIGFFQMRSDTTGNIILSKFKLRTLAEMNTTGALGSRDWKRAGVAPSEDPKKPAKK